MQENSHQQTLARLQNVEMFQLRRAASRAKTPWTAPEIGEGDTLPALEAWTHPALLGLDPKSCVFKLDCFALLPFASLGLKIMAINNCN